MIYPENFIFDMVADVLREEYADRKILVTGEYTDTPARFPAVTIIQSDSRERIQSRTINGEQAATLMYEVTVYDNTVGYKKMHAYEIMETVDAVMTGRITPEGRQLGFYRTMCSPIPNLQDSTIFSLVARYQGVDKPEYLEDGTIIHRIYTS